MSTTTSPAPAGVARTTSGGRLGALSRAELTLLLRNKTALVVALLLPVALTFLVRSTVENVDLGGTGLSVGSVILAASIGFVLLFSVYANLVGFFVVRREELVLKRLRCGEPRDAEILTACALPTVVLALAQITLLTVGAVIAFDVTAPQQVVLSLLGLVMGLALAVAAAAVTAMWSRSAEAAQITTLPLMLITFMGSGVVIPLEVLPDTFETVCGFLPFSPIMELVRGGWAGSLDAGEWLRAVAVGAAWIALAAWLVSARFRWEPRR
ncbi:ABC transporter permease [Streptomyces sp. DSM 42041]|uniref:ABC transporter permease n=1 Tax=Streptomyces hazeniae TaxID=3075538 RepID=A0ABU2NPJ1_9ACTN|nr:ABC transporter permease [Streptomyces sp. DSM 42041]MDT0377553.1 ABC transporter permease [Streptomyces sp. DSM 42041]